LDVDISVCCLSKDMDIEKIMVCSGTEQRLLGLSYLGTCVGMKLH
jgi:hypothetical protein